ncbi:MAG: tetratricopeptide repeat protein, partial [Elusimicrobiota bacterium]
QGRYDEAVALLRSATEARPGFLHARGSLGELYNHLGRYKEGLATFQDYVATAPAQPWALAMQGYSKGKLGDHLGAIADSIKAVDMLPSSPSLLVELASRYIDAGKLIGAEDALMHALELHPKEARVYVRLGYVYLLEHKEDLAITLSEKGLVEAEFGNRRRERAYAHLNLARAYGRRGDLDKAFAHARQALDDGPVPLSQLTEDPGLAAMRADPRFRALAR